MRLEYCRRGPALIRARDLLRPFPHLFSVPPCRNFPSFSFASSPALLSKCDAHQIREIIMECRVMTNVVVSIFFSELNYLTKR